MFGVPLGNQLKVYTTPPIITPETEDRFAWLRRVAEMTRDVSGYIPASSTATPAAQSYRYAGDDMPKRTNYTPYVIVGAALLVWLMWRAR